MVKVYAVALAIGLVGLLVVILGGAFAENINRGDRDPGARIGMTGRMMVGGLTGFGMAGLSAEFAPLGLGWPVSLLVAAVGAGLSALWVRVASAAGEAD
jgi:hypothetical protein